MSSLPVPLAVLYAGLVGTLLALIVATAQNRWSPRVFFLLALRLAIGWHFLFEGLYKIQSHYAGPSETTRAFTSEPYFRAAPGPVGGFMRRQFEDPAEIIAAKVKSTKEIPPAAFAKLSAEEQAAECPTAVAQQLDQLESNVEESIKKEAAKELSAADSDETKAIKAILEAEEKSLKEAKTEDEKKQAHAKAESEKKKVKERVDGVRQAARKKGDSLKEAGASLITAAKATYARWVYGVDGRATKVKFVTGEVFLTAPQRLAHLEWLRSAVNAADEERGTGLGNGYGTEVKRAAELRTDLLTAETDLAHDASAFVAELKKELNGGKAPEEQPVRSTGQRMDKITMWFLAILGGCLMAGLFTRVSCVLAAGFLVVTYLAHPAFPWFPQPPNTEGNPVFINKNVIECLALLALACMPTGRWLGLDAIVLRPLCRYKCEGNPPATSATK